MLCSARKGDVLVLVLGAVLVRVPCLVLASTCPALLCCARMAIALFLSFSFCLAACPCLNLSYGQLMTLSLFLSLQRTETGNGGGASRVESLVRTATNG